MENRVQLGDKYYVLEEGTKINRTPFVEWTQNIRTTGQQSRSDRPFYSSWPLKGLTGGVGLKRIDVDVLADLKRLRDSTCETRWPGQVTPAIEPQAATKSSTDQIVTAPVHFQGNDYVIAVDSSRNVECKVWNAGTENWDASGTIDAGDAGLDSNIAGSYDLIVHQGRLVAVWSYVDGGNDNGGLATSTDGSTWVQASASPFPSNEQTRFLLSFGDTLIIVNYEDGTIYIEKTTDFLETNEVSVVDITSGASPTGVANFFDTGGTAAPFVGTEEGWWMIDVANGKAELYGDLGEMADSSNCKRMKQWNNRLMIPVAAAGMIQYTAGGVSSQIGLDLDDGLVAEAQGDITAIAKTNLWLFVAVGGGAAGKYARVWALDLSGAWHCIYRHGTANQVINFIGVTSGVLHIIYATGAATTSEVYLPDVLVNSVNATSFKWADDCYIELPEFDGGIPEFGMSIFKIFVDADDLSGANEYISVFYGLDGAVSTTVDLGDITDTIKSLAFGVDGVGVIATRIQPRLILKRSANTLAPKFRSAVLYYLVTPGSATAADNHERQVFEFTIDIEKSASLDEHTLSTEDVISNLNTIRKTKTLSMLKYGRNVDTKVICIGMPFAEDVRDTYNEINEGEREGLVLCQFMEM